MTIRATITITTPLAIRVDDASLVGLKGGKSVAVEGVVVDGAKTVALDIARAEQILKSLGLEATITIVALS